MHLQENVFQFRIGIEELLENKNVVNMVDICTQLYICTSRFLLQNFTNENINLNILMDKPYFHIKDVNVYL